MRCKKCNQRLADHDIWCVSCGSMTSVVDEELSAWASFKQTWLNYAGHTSSNALSAGFTLIFGLLPMLILAWLFRGLLHYEYDSAWSFVLYQVVKALAYSVFLPFLLLPFKSLAKDEDYLISFPSYLSALKSYPRYYLLSLLITIYYVIIYIICFGLPGLGSDPILRLVWLVLVNYWLAILLPVPVLMERQEIGIWSALKLSYRHFHDLRWNLYLLVLILFILNGLALAMAVAGLIFTLPLSWFAIRDYTQKLVDFELLSYRR